MVFQTFINCILVLAAVKIIIFFCFVNNKSIYEYSLVSTVFYSLSLYIRCQLLYLVLPDVK